MKLRTTTIIAALVFLTLVSSSSGAGPAERSVTRSTESNWSYGQRSVSYEITVDDISTTPAWANPSKEAPPLSIGQAVDISKQQLSIYVPDVPDWVVGTIKLELFDEPDRWYYVVSWRPASVGDRDGRWLHIPVLMNGVPVKLTLEAATPPKREK